MFSEPCNKSSGGSCPSRLLQKLEGQIRQARGASSWSAEASALLTRRAQPLKMWNPMGFIIHCQKSLACARPKRSINTEWCSGFNSSVSTLCTVSHCEESREDNCAPRPGSRSQGNIRPTGTARRQWRNSARCTRLFHRKERRSRRRKVSGKSGSGRTAVRINVKHAGCVAPPHKRGSFEHCFF